MKDNAKKLIRLAKAGDKEAFSKLYELYFTPVFRYLYCRTSNYETSEDLCQEVFLKACRAIPRFRFQGRPFLSYLFTIARHSLIDYFRKRKEVLLENDREVAGSGSPQKDIINQEELDLLHRALKDLSPDQKEVIVLRFLAGLDNQEVSHLLDKSQEAVRQLQSRALKILRKFFEEHER